MIIINRSFHYDKIFPLAIFLNFTYYNKGGGGVVRSKIFSEIEFLQRAISGKILKNSIQSKFQNKIVLLSWIKKHSASIYFFIKQSPILRFLFELVFRNPIRNKWQNRVLHIVKNDMTCYCAFYYPFQCSRDTHRGAHSIEIKIYEVTWLIICHHWSWFFGSSLLCWL